MPAPRDIALRLAEWHVVTEAGCWEWVGSRTPKGYGKVHFKGRTKRAHRISYELAHGPIPNGLTVCHTCDNPPCINPAHLFLGTNADNRRDMMAKGRSCAPKRPASGERNGFAKLTAAIVREIRALAAAGSLTKVEIGRRYGISGAHVANIASGRSWADDRLRQWENTHGVAV